MTLDEQLTEQIFGELIARYRRVPDRQAYAWLHQIADGAALLNSIHRVFAQPGAPRDATTLDHHARMSRNLAGLLPKVVEMLGNDIDGTILASIVEGARMFGARQLADMDVAGRA